MNQELIVLDDEKTVGFSDLEKQLLAKFMAMGKPDIAKAAKEEIKIKELYFKNKSVTEICNFVRIKKPAVLGLIYANGWAKEMHDTRMAMLETISLNMQTAKIESAHFMLEWISFVQSYYRDRMKLYEETKDNSIIENTDIRLMGMYNKFLETLGVTGNTTNQPSPTVHINAGEGSTVTVKGSDSDNKDSAKILEALADMQRQKARMEGKK